MNTVTNKTRRPLKVPLPGGKLLRLGPGKTGQVAPKALDHPPLKKMVEAGDIEITAVGGANYTSGESGDGGGPSGRGPSAGGMRHVGDR